MTDSAIPRRGRRSTELRIVDAAQRLADERGSLDGFTMDELAVEVDVSRRTLFNYFPSKVDAVLGPDLVVPPGALAIFIEGGPTGDLIDDLQAVALAILHNEVVDAATITRFDRLVHANPILLVSMKQRLMRLVERLVDAAVQRSDGGVPARDAKLAVAVLAGAADVAITDYLDDPELDFAELFVSAIAAIRRLFG